MVYIRSWRFWVIVALALGTLACAGRAEKRERREEAREERRERAEARRAERQERAGGRRAQREDEPKSAPASTPAPSTNKQTTSTLTPVSTAPSAAAMQDGRIVFLRPSGYGGAIAATVFDVTGSGDSRIIGIINMRGQLTYSVKPGVHTFMVVSEAADFMQVTVDPGKTYYALVRPRMGAWKARFSFEPLRAGDKRALQWERSTNSQNNQARADNWMRSNASSVEDKRSRYWPEWANKPESAREAQTLRAEDGF